MEGVMEIDLRFPSTRASQLAEGRDSVPESQLPQAVAGSTAGFYISPVLRFDSRSLTVIFQVRDSGSGDVVRQFPAEAVVERYRQDPSLKPFVLPSNLDESDAEDDGVEDPVIVSNSAGIAGDPDPASPEGAAESPGNPASQQASSRSIDLVA
jgi:hypothetical protein